MSHRKVHKWLERFKEWTGVVDDAFCVAIDYIFCLSSYVLLWWRRGKILSDFWFPWQ
jgi:hypothetical protein